MPRLSVDIDAVLLDPTSSRQAALAVISDELARIRSELERMRLTVTMPANQQGDEVKLVVSDAISQVKVEVNQVEVNQVFRGTLYPAQSRSLVAAAEDLFTTSVTLPVLASQELYGSKLVAAFDRQHPRDWFDVQHMRQRHGLTTQVVDSFVVYLAGHNRPIHEVLFPNLKPMRAIFEGEFAGLTREAVSVEQLEQTRAETLAELPHMLSDAQRQFLLSITRATPQWDLLPLRHVAELPAVRWKLENLERLRTRNPRKFAAQHEELAARLAAS